MSPIESRYINTFGEAAKMAAILELRLRLLADRDAPTRPKALANNLEDVENAILQHFAPLLSAADVATIKAARGIRNKLLHCEFWTAEKRLLAANTPVVRTDISSLCLDTGEERSLDQITADDKEGRLFAWALNGMARGGLFETAEKTFVDAINIVIRLRDTDLD